MSRRHSAPIDPDPAIAAALETLDADELRVFMHDMLRRLDSTTRGQIVDRLLDRVARGGSGWTPPAPADSTVVAIEEFATGAANYGQADPDEVDGYLRDGSTAFLARDYRSARRIFAALLGPLTACEIDLGQHEMIDEVLSVDVNACSAQYVVSAYMTAAPADRARVVLSTIDEVQGIAFFREPLRDLEAAAVEALPGLDAFLPMWQASLNDRLEHGSVGWRGEESRWLREVVGRLEGGDGLASLARSTGHEDDLRAWCRLLEGAGDWSAALAAFEEAAEITADVPHNCAGFLDGAARAAQQLGRTDVAARLEAAWRRAPEMLRLRRWLGMANTTRDLKDLATRALRSCPDASHRQSGLLLVLIGDFESAAGLLATAPGLGWSGWEHPGHLLFPLFVQLLAREGSRSPEEVEATRQLWLESHERVRLTTVDDKLRVRAPEIGGLLARAGIGGTRDARDRRILLEAMRLAAEARVAGVTGNARRRHYGHAAQLVADCAAIEATDEARAWVEQLMSDYRRYPALQREFAARVGRG